MTSRTLVMTAAALVVLVSAACKADPKPESPPPATSSTYTAPPASALAAPLPRPLFKTHFNSGSGKYLFKNRDWDLSQIKRSFNAVIVDFGDPKLVEDIRGAGLAAIVEFDEKQKFAQGQSVDPTVRAIIRQVKEHPGTISGIRVADRVNEKLTPEKALAYLEKTGGVFHKEIPGVPVFVDVEDWELTCGLKGQTSCNAHTSDEYRYCTNDVLQSIYRSGYVDGFELAVNLKNDDPDAMRVAMQKARKLFPPPFMLTPRSAALSFDGGTFGGNRDRAGRQVAAYIEAPMRAGVDGIDLWAWHRPWKAELRTFMNKDGSTNPLWDRMTQAYAAATAKTDAAR